MGDNEEHLWFMLFFDNYVKKREKTELRNIVNETIKVIKRVFSNVFKENLGEELRELKICIDN